MTGVTEKELLGQVRQALDLGDIPTPEGEAVLEVGVAALAELEARADERERMGMLEWPQEVFDAAVGVLGQGVCNRNGRLRKALDRKVGHALRVWDDKYGPLNPEQAAYAARCLARCFGVELELPQMHVRLDLIVNHEMTHAGFLRRAEGLAA